MKRPRPASYEYEAHIAALERKVGQLTMELDLVKKTPRQPIVGDSGNSSIVTGPRLFCQTGCKMIDLPRSTYYYRSTAKALNLSDSQLVAIIEDIQDELPCYGYRRLTHELQRRGHLVQPQAGRPRYAGQWPRDQASQAVCSHDG